MSRPAMISPTTCGALHLRATKAKELCAEDDNCQVTENRIHKESFLYYKIPRTIYIPFEDG